MYAIPASQCAEYSKKEINEYNLELHTARSQMDLYGKLKKMVGKEYSHLHNVEDLWENCRDDKEVHMRYYMRMMAYFFKKFNLFLMPDQVVEDENTVIDPWYDVISNLSLPLIDWDKEEVNDLDVLTNPIEARKKRWIYEQVAPRKFQGVTLTYGELEDEPKSETDSGTIVAPSGETSKSPPTTRSKKRKEVVEHQPKHKVYSRKPSKGEPSKKAKKLGGFTEMPTI